MHLNVHIFSVDGVIKVFLPETSITEKEKQPCIESVSHVDEQTGEPALDSPISNISTPSASTTQGHEQQKENRIPNLDAANTKLVQFGIICIENFIMNWLNTIDFLFFLFIQNIPNHSVGI